MPFTLTSLLPTDHTATATLLHSSLVSWYESNLRQGARFGDSPDPFILLPDVYAALDPDQAIAARDTETGSLLGVCFVHPRETHHAVGIVATAPEAAGRGIARAMMTEAIRRATAVGHSLRLVSSLLNLDSFSLYTRLGFVPGAVFQDLLFNVPESGLPVPAPDGTHRVRLARPYEAAALADYELSLQGIRREQDYQFFLENRVGQWRVWVSEDTQGQIDGFLVASLNPAMPMLGPGVVATATTAPALIWTALNDLPGKSYVLLAPASAAPLIQTLYTWGARNIELHIAQSHGPTPAITRGLTFPTFLPESA
jgi:GNAT superfamily N-acetyltransferase